MERNCLISFSLIIGCILLLQVSCQKQTVSPEGPEIELAKTEPAVSSEKAEIVPETSEPTPKITFENLVFDFGNVGSKTSKTGEFKFKNTGEGMLKITKVETCCGCYNKLSKTEYAPGESGTLKVDCRWAQRPGVITRHIYVNSNDKQNPRVALTIKAKIISIIDYKPEKLNLLLNEENAGCPDITLKSGDKKPFSITAFKSTGNCITADVKSTAAATEFVLKPEVDMAKLQKNLNGFIEISLAHPESKNVTIPFNTLPKFKVNPPVIIVFNAEPQKSTKRDIWVLNNYSEDFEVESISSKNDIIKVLSREKISNGYHFEVEITPPGAESKQKIFTDVFTVNIEGNEPLAITCRGFYSRRTTSPPD